MRCQLLARFALASLPAAAGDTSTWVESSLARVMPASQPPSSSSSGGSAAPSISPIPAAISLAANEGESFQIAMRSDTNTTYSVAVGAVAAAASSGSAAAGSAPAVTWGQVGLVHVAAIVSNPQGGPGWWPDPVLPTSHAFGLAGLTTAIWVTVSAPTDAAAGKHSCTITLTPTGSAADVAPIVVRLIVTVFGFALPTTPALLTAFNMGEGALAKAYNETPRTPSGMPDAEIKAMWEATGCSNPYSATAGEQPLWHQLTDGGASDMFAYCEITKSGKASAGQKVRISTKSDGFYTENDGFYSKHYEFHTVKAVCGTVPGTCKKQHLPGTPAGNDPSKRAGHAHFVQWSHWLLSNFSLNPGTIYSPDVPFTVPELEEMVPLGLNSFTAFRSTMAAANDTGIASYVKALEASKLGLIDMATTYGYDESDMLDEMQSVFAALKVAYPKVKTFTTAHMCGTPTDWQKPMVPCYGTCPGPSCQNGTTGLPVQDPAQIKARNIDYMCPVLDWIKPENVTACEEAGLKMWMYTSLEPWKKVRRPDLPQHLIEFIFGTFLTGLAAVLQLSRGQRALREPAALLADGADEADGVPVLEPERVGRTRGSIKQHCVVSRPTPKNPHHIYFPGSSLRDCL